MSQSKKRVLVVGERKRTVYQRFVSILSKEFIVKELYVLPDPDNPPFFVLRWFSVIKNWRKLLKKFKPNKVLICGDALISIWIIVFLVKLFRLKIEIILFRYDIENLRPYFRGFEKKVGHFITRQIEKYCFVRADKIIHKGLENELEFLRFYKKIKDKPHYLFREFIDPKLIKDYDPSRKKLSEEDGEIHLVRIGNTLLEDLQGIESIWKLYPKITKQGIHIHFYSKVPKGIVKRLKEFDKKDPYFHYEGFMEHSRLIDEMSKYDYGFHIHGIGNPSKKRLDIWFKTGFGNKNYDYALAYLPVICSKNLEATRGMIEKNKIGFPIDYNEIENLKIEILKNKKRYPPFIKNIKKFIKRSTDAKPLINFIKG